MAHATATDAPKEWIRQRKRDPYYRRARTEGYRSRAAYKLKEINSRTRIIRRGNRVLDLGASPGGWSQIAAEIVGQKGAVVAVDLIGMEPVKGVDFIILIRTWVDQYPF